MRTLKFDMVLDEMMELHISCTSQATRPAPHTTRNFKSSRQNCRLQVR